MLLGVAGKALADPPSGGQVVDGADYQPPVLLEQTHLDYPDEAIELGIHGDVTVEVLVDAEGRVTHVDVVEGPPVFHAEAIAAGLRLRFAPATSAQQAVPALVRVYFHFAPVEEIIEEGPITEVLVVADDPDAHDTRARTTLDEAVLERSAGQDLAQATAEVAGVTVSRGNASTAKPIIRGQAERRLLLLRDGVRHESQKWGADHAPEIDTLSAGSITVVKGAAGARYGPDAIGGVILVEPPPMRASAGWGGRALVAGGLNGRRGTAAARLDWVPAEGSPWSFRLHGSASRAASQQAPHYVLGNTAESEVVLGLAAQLRAGSRTTVRLTADHYGNRAGVFYGATAASPDELQAQLEADPPGADAWTVDYEISRPYQAVTHDRATLHVDHEGPNGGGWQAIYAVQLNHRAELDRVRESVDRAQYDFRLQTHTVDLLLEHAPVLLGPGTLEGAVGGQGIVQVNVYEGLSLLPNYVAYGGGIFGYERYAPSRALELEVGARIDRLQRTAYVGEAEFELGVREGLFDPDACSQPGYRFVCPGGWTAASLSAGALWHVVPDAVDAKLDLSSASRIPGPDEQYLVGAAPTLPVYSVGNGDLGIETTWNASATLGVRRPWIESEVSVWGSLVDDYVYFAPVLNADGEPRIDVTIRGAWPRYGHTPVPARFSGIDGRVSLGPEAVVGLDVLGAMVRARHRETGDFLVGTPPDRASATAWVRPRVSPEVPRLALGATLEGVARQSRTAPRAEIAPPPDGYVLLGLRGQAEIELGERTLRLGLEVENLLDTAYRDYTSLLRYYADFPGRDVRLHAALDF